MGLSFQICLASNAVKEKKTDYRMNPTTGLEFTSIKFSGFHNTIYMFGSKSFTKYFGYYIISMILGNVPVFVPVF